MRISTACQTCRARRRKCETPQLGAACTYCVDRNLQCTRDSATYTQPQPAQTVQNVPNVAGQRELIALASPTQSFISPVSILPPQAICLELVHLYFDFIHDQFHSLFHRPSMVEDVEQGRTPPVLLLAMMALSARFSTNPYFANTSPRDRGNEYAKESTRLLDLREVNVTTLQACVLLGAFSITCGEGAAESLYYCVACRTANLLDLANMPTSDAVEREVNVRLWRSLCMIDVWSSAGVRLPRSMPILDTVPLPIDEGTFLSLRRSQLLPLTFDQHTSSSSSLLAQMIRLNLILLEINTLNERTVSALTSGVQLENEVMALSNALDDWHASLPAFMHDTPENLRHWTSLGLGRVFIAVYLGYYHFGQLLFYQFLHGDVHATVLSAKFYAQKCKAHAASLCEIIYRGLEVPGADVQYTMVGHILVIASTVQIHTLLFSSSDSQIAEARSRLEKNFEILSRLRNYWPTLDVSFTRLRAFHKACRREMEESFRLDVWMLRFLSGFAEVVSDREISSGEEEWVLENIGVSPGSGFGG